ncbi:MAG TPA: lysozyme inhibitor LprI family protein [Pyrinomonadaceae bacterium]|nr:lysozyme inhibitor LprI family protein [Pyrinomonadaceae bacterium]
MKRIASAILLASVLLAAAHAQKREEQSPCGDAQTQAELNMCAGRKFKEADAELNRVYNQLTSKVEAPYRAKLKAAEVSWLKYRDDNCDYETALYEGGSMRPMVYSFCLERMTKARTAELREQIKELDEQ